MANLQKEVDQWMFEYEKTKEEVRVIVALSEWN